ncbi:MAG: glycosyltransferase family 4 protein [Opitutae bacterium]|nr:glycosyltransferase family 4 protein [Opitutae bacterium]
MKTLLLSPELFLAEGGISRIMRLYLKALCELARPGDQVDYIALNDEPGSDPRIGRYATDRLGERLGCRRGKFEFTRRALRLSLRADRVVCGHLHQLPVVWFASLLRPRLAYFVVAHGIDVWRPYSALERRCLLRADRILCVSEYTRRQMLRFCRDLDPAKLLVVPNTLDPYFVPVEPTVPTAPPAGHPRLLAVSRIATTDTYKGVDTLIEAMPLVRREFPSARLRIVGGGDDLPRLRELARSEGVAAAVDFTGIINDDALRAEYAACDLFALPSRKEGFGLVFLEAMTYGKPCLGARAGGVPEVINDSVGALVEYGNIPDLAAAVADLVHHPRDAALVRAHADSFAFPAFTRRLAAALT